MNTKSATALRAQGVTSSQPDPPLPLGNDQGPRGRMTQDGHRPEVIIGHPPLFLKISGHSRALFQTLFLHHFSAASKTTPRPSFGTKSKPKVAPKNAENDKKNAPRRSPRKVARNTQKMNQEALGICDFTWNVLQNRCFQDLPRTLASPQKTHPTSSRNQ